MRPPAKDRGKLIPKNGIVTVQAEKDPKISQTSNSVITTTHRCPEYEGYKEAGLDHETIKKLCLCTVGSIDATLQKLGGNGGLTINKYRSSSDDFCIHEFKKKK